jgi:hypothetical protein
VTSVRTFWEVWVAFWDRRERPESLALTRILVGGVLSLELAGMALGGLVPALWLAPPRGLGWASLTEDASNLSRALGASPVAVTALWGLAFAAALAVTVGVGLRPAAFGCALVTATLGRLAPDGERAIDELLRLVLIVLALSRADACWSLRAWRRGRLGVPAEALIPAWPRQLLLAQLIWVYFSAAQNRGGSEWWPWGGCVALGRVLSDPHFARFSPGWTASIYPLTRVATAFTLLFELGSPLIVLFTFLDRHPDRGGALGRGVRRLRLRWVWLGLGASLHLGIAVTLRLGLFPFGMLALYPLFLAPEELSALLARGRSARSRMRGRARLAQ